MPKSNLDWLGVISLWIGAIIMAVRSGGLPLMSGAPSWLTSAAWGYVPAILITFYMLIALYRAAAPHSVAAKPEPMTSTDKQDAATPVLERHRALQTMAIAKGQARTAISRNSVREAEKEWPRMYAALLSANKLFGVSMPPTGHGALLDLECGSRLLEKVIPLLSAGHDDEARREAEAFVSGLTPK